MLVASNFNDKWDNEDKETGVNHKKMQNNASKADKNDAKNEEEETLTTMSIPMSGAYYTVIKVRSNIKWWGIVQEKGVPRTI